MWLPALDSWRGRESSNMCDIGIGLVSAFLRKLVRGLVMPPAPPQARALELRGSTELDSDGKMLLCGAGACVALQFAVVIANPAVRSRPVFTRAQITFSICFSECCAED
jgi:hypothetical protein